MSSFDSEGFKARNYDFLHEVFNKCDILFLRATWLYQFEHYQFINILSDCQYHAVSAMHDADVHRRGRSYGGCAVLWHRDLAMSLPDCQYHAVSAMDDADVHHCGRPYGGCAVLWHRDLAMSFVPVETSTPRICAVHVKSKHMNCILASVYMPNDNDTDTTFNMYGDILYELSSLVNLYIVEAI